MQRLADPFSNEGRALRNLQMDIDSSLDRRGRPTGRTQALVDQYKAATGAYLGEPGQERVAATERYKADQSLRGNMYQADSSRASHAYTANQSLRGDMLKAAAAARKQADDDVIRQNDLDIRNADRTRQRFGVYTDGKLDEAATNQAILALDKIAPGFSRMSEDARGKALPQADALFNIYNRTRSGRELGLGQAVFGNTNPQNDNLPNFKGGKLLRQGLAGVLPGQAGKDGYYVRMPDGREVQLGAGLSENELKLIRRNIETGGWKD